MNRNLATGVALLSGLLLAIPTSPLSAAAQEQTELTSNIAAKAEATVVAKQLDNDDFGSAGPDVASYEARFSDEGESDDNLVARFPTAVPLEGQESTFLARSVMFPSNLSF